MAGSENGHRIVVTGGPGAGKTTAADLFRRELGDRVVVVPEAATLLFGGGFPRHDDPDAIRAAQRAIYFVQRGLEDTQAAQYPGRVLICDRGTLDGACYWPDTPDSYFDDVGSSVEAELQRYDAVIFFETAAAGGLDIEGGNPTRIEDRATAVRLDRQLRELWSRHPRFFYVPHHTSFFKKIAFGLVSLEGVVAQLDRHRSQRSGAGPDERAPGERGPERPLDRARPRPSPGVDGDLDRTANATRGLVED